MADSARSDRELQGRRSLGRPGALARLVVLLVVLTVIQACRTNDLAFRQDERLTVLEPEHRETVQIPVRVRWQMDDFTVTEPDGSGDPGRGHFAVFVDQAPPAPGVALDSLANGDEACKTLPGCPDRQWFEDRGIYETSDTSVMLESLGDLRPPRQPNARDRHEITIILLNGRRERISETAYTREFFVDRSKSPF